MRSLFTLLALMIILSMASPSFAGTDCNGKNNCNDDHSVSSTSKNVALGLGQGGDADVKNSGNSSVSNTTKQGQIGINKQGQDQDQTDQAL